jgi:Tol biopolymer transport system component
MTWPRISPDGRLLAMIATDTAGVASIWIRPLDALEAHLLPGTTGSGRPFWSPDSRYLAYFTEGKLRKVAVAGGPPVVVCDALGAADGDWGSRDIIVFDGSSSDSIRWVSASGGAVHAASSFDRSKHETQHAWPHFLPDGRHFLYQASGTGDDGAIKVGSLDSKESRELGRTDGRVEFARDGYILFPRGGTLMVQPFDPRSLKTTGDAVPFGEHLTMGGSVGFFSSSDDGVLAYGLEDAVQKSQLQWVDRAGRTLARIGATAQYRDLALSPDGKRVAIGMGTVEGAGEDIWVLDLSRGVGSRLTFGDGNNIWPIWTPDGSRVVYCNNRGGEFRLMTRLANGQGGVDSLAHARGGQDGPSDWSGDGRYVALSRFGATSWDVSMLPQFGERKPYDLLATPFRERDARFSPDGRWLAYSSNESGRSEVYVTSFPGPGGKWQVSTGGGEQPYWRSDGREIFYRSLDQGIMAVPIQAGAAPDVGTPVELFKTVLEGGGFVRNRWMPAADGQRFLLDVPSGAPTGARFAIVTNWAEELKRR